MESNVSSKVLLYNVKTSALELFTKPKNNNLVVGFCGIGDPPSFVQTSRKFFNLEELVIFPDHHKYTDNDFGELLQKCSDKKIDSIVTTYKDFVKIESLYNNIKNFNINLLIIDIEVKITKEKLLMDQIDHILLPMKG